MAKFFNCVERLNQAAGRRLTDDEMERIFETIHQSALSLKAGRPAGVKSKQGPAVDSVIAQVAQDAAGKYIAEAARAQRNASLQIIKQAARQDDIDSGVAAGIAPLDSLMRLIANRADGRMNVKSLENRVIGIESDMRRQLNDTWTALGDDFLGFVQNVDKIKLLLREMKGENTGDALAKKGAEAWLKVTETARQRFNDGGGDIGKLDDWGMPQHHSQELVARATEPTWVNAVLPALDRSKYVDDLGRQWDDARMTRFLGKVWHTIATNGYANLEPGKSGGKGAVSNRHSDERVLHFASADAYINYWGRFGEKTFPQILDSHITGMASDIGFIEQFGPNADATYKTLRDNALKAQAKADPTGTPQAERAAIRADNLWNTATGKTLPVADTRIAKFFDTIGQLNAAGKLGSAFWASVFGDKVMFETMGHLNNIPAMQRWRNELAMLNPANTEGRADLRRQGLMLEYMRTSMTRFGDSLGDSSLTGKLANSVMRVSGMNAINEWRRGAFGLSLMDALGRSVSAHSFVAATRADMHLLKSFGITEFDWNVWKLAKMDDYGGGNDKMLTPDAISRITDDELRQAGLIAPTAGPKDAQRVRTESITTLLGAINSESRYGVIEPGYRERAQMFANAQRGTVKGEIWRAFLQFKSFPIAQFERQWDVAMSRPQFGGKVATLAAIMGMQAVAGAMLIQTRDLLAGKDPRPMDWKFGLASFLQGGALGIYGDFLHGINQTRHGSGLLEVAAGPTIGPAVDFLTSTLNAAKQASEGKETHLGAKYLQIAKGFIPANNLWYTKAATDHLIFQNIQEQLAPGYLANMQARAQKEYKQGYWWTPGEVAPSRAPDFSNAGPR